MKKRQIAVFGDIHACFDELWEIVQYIKIVYPGIELWHLGDLVDRGPHSDKVVDFVMKHFTGGIKGNHEVTLIKMWKKKIKDNYVPKNPDKAKTLAQMNQKRIDYLDSLPLMHVMDDLKCILVHGGIYPKVPLYRQAELINVCRLQMMKRSDVDRIMADSKNTDLANRWWGPDAAKQPKVGRTEEESNQEGYIRWYEEYDHEYDVMFGHSVVAIEPKIFPGKNGGDAIALDTGSCFGGFLTAYIYPDRNPVQIPCKKYAGGKGVTSMMMEQHEQDKKKEEEKKIEKSYEAASINFTKYMETKEGTCKFCGEGPRQLCEHGNCRVCKCRHYCWLD